ncbi:SusC/RagA family TonB-linked outer membrane protein [Tenuifilaceae bacterium CYCD]|nr:SusC/RagA family TonB-linked outer membrane protein [Tenuifilaceae bacterium CYCD]
MQAQTVRITGTITSSEDGMPLPGVSVIVKGTTIGGATDANGKYEINAPADAQILTFSFVGFKVQDIAIAGRAIIDVVLQSESVEMQEVVVTALGITREKKALGYTVQGVSGDDVVKAGNPNVMTALSGKVAGVEIRQSSGMPGAPSTVLIRGARSFSGTNTPLYVIDGMPISSESDYTSNVTGTAYSNRAMDIDPNDIESINVLKGQAAAALYGLRASNGVIIITTKKGKGAQVGTPVVNFSSSVTIDKVSLMPELQTTYAQGSGFNFKAANSFSWGPKVTDLPNDPTYGGNSNGHPGQFFDPYKAMWVTPKAYKNAENFYDKNGLTFVNSIIISNATSMGNYSIGLGSTNQSGIIDRTGMDRYTAKMGGDFKLTDKWNMGFSGNYSDISMKKLPSGNDSWLFTVYGAPPSYDLNGGAYHQDGTFGKYRQISYRRGAVGVNPYWAIYNNHYYESTKRFFGNAYLEFKPAKWATIKYQIGIDTYGTDNEMYKEMGYGNLPTAAQYTSPTKPTFTYLEPTGGEIHNYGLNRRVINSLLTVSLTHSFTQELNGNLLFGTELDDNQSEFYSAYGTGFTTPGWNNLSNTNTQQSDYDEYHRRTGGVFANLGLDYKGMLFFNATGRYDKVSSMPRDNRGFFYPSASLGFLFTELEPIKGNTILSYGKVRASYAEVGQAADQYSPSPVYVTGGGTSGFLDYGISYPFNGVSGYKLTSTLYDPNLKPQNTSTVELGVELKFLNNRVGLDYSYYNQKASDQIFPVPLAGSTGYSELYMNAGEMVTNGHEIILTASPVKTSNLEWDLSLNFTKSVTEVKKLAEGVESISLGGYETPNIRASAGDSYPTIYGERFARDDQGRILVDDNGLPMVGQFGKIGDVSPDFIVGLNNSFTIMKYVNVSAQLEWKQGGEMYSGSNRLIGLYGTAKFTEDRETPFIYKGYKSDGTPNDIERGGSADNTAYEELYNTLEAIPEAWIEETSFIKLREVAISFNIPSKYLSPLKIKNASIGFVTRNILLWAAMDNFDPETSQGQGNMQGGMDYMSLPQTTSYGFNLNLTF